MISKIYIAVFILLAAAFFSCNNNNALSNEDAGDSITAVTPVKVTTIEKENIQDNILLNAVSVFQKKSIIKSSINGYIQTENITPGQTINQGQILFVLKTKEAQIIGNELPDSLRFNNAINIKATQSGYVTQLDHQQGDYVQDGEQLCVIADKNSFVFLLQVPFELTTYLKIGSNCNIILPNHQQITGKITARVPAVDPVTQTQQYVIKINPQLHLPENLIAKISITKSVNADAQTLPKAAVLADETESHFWVMKMINDSTAVKVPVKEGTTNDDKVQILSPQFSPSDRILISGNYGLPDTALVKIIPTTKE